MITNLYKSKEVAEILKVKPVTIRRWCKSGMLKARKIGKSWYIPEEELILFKNENNEAGIKIQ
ncbi:MAG: helix-turn-helix domain-containing protein [Actinobacteria bacterium]|nr:helix-turn-helix domain-containing protein [Actinomycetota bacterium]